LQSFLLQATEEGLRRPVGKGSICSPFYWTVSIRRHVQALDLNQHDNKLIDGLALGETTPGPLIMIVAFVGFIGGWTNALFGADLFLAGALGAFVATFFTFLPSCVFILAGGPLVESTRDNIKLTAPLTAISAAVVGVIMSLPVFFAEHVFNIAKPVQQWDFPAIAISLAACIALFRFKLGTIKLIGACGLAGLFVSYLV
jgi:chromate transporter